MADGVWGTSNNLQSAFSDFGGAANSLFGSFGNEALAASERKAAGYLDRAAGLSRENASLSQEATRIKQSQAQRSIEHAIGGQQADVAGAGFVASGSALDLLADSQHQGELTHYLLAKQGEIDVNSFNVAAEGYAAQAEAQRGAAEAHDAASIGGMISSAISTIAGVAQIGMFLR